MRGKKGSGLKPGDPCPKCGDFRRHKGGGCAPCDLKKTRDYRAANREKVLLRDRASYQRRREREREKSLARYRAHRDEICKKNREAYWLDPRGLRFRMVARKHGLTADQLQSMLENQRGRCAACGDELVSSRETHVDHDHTTGAVRAILCRGCNHAVGNMKDDPMRAEKLVIYLRKHAP